jgi:hypothetical protein
MNMPAKSRSIAPRNDQPIGVTQMDAMFEHQVQEGIRRNKPTVSAHEEMAVKFKNEMAKMGMPLKGQK